MVDKNEKIILKFLNENIDTQYDYNAEDISKSTLDLKIDKNEIAIVCSRLYSKRLIDSISVGSSNAHNLNNTYRINEKGMEELNPFSRSKIQHTFIILGTIFAGIAAIGVIITLDVVTP